MRTLCEGSELSITGWAIAVRICKSLVREVYSALGRDPGKDPYDMNCRYA
jgi:hypothetical protein